MLWQALLGLEIVNEAEVRELLGLQSGSVDSMTNTIRTELDTFKEHLVEELPYGVGEVITTHLMNSIAPKLEGLVKKRRERGGARADRGIET